ncbi:MAG: type II toxin-antitoxin system RelB/DinJ family antitoxin [Eggerthellaceae bacterium]|nr:type II toxin-antitoxin system RelB/DinJ family antitoxin [Eggerthellaceae bacterium]
MAELTSLNIKIDRDLKREADLLFNEMGMTLSTAVNVFVRQAIQEQAIPFQIHLNEKAQFHKLIDEMRAVASEHGFMTDEDIEAEIQAARMDTRMQDQA